MDRGQWRVLPLLLLAGMAQPAVARPQSPGDAEFQVNTFTTGYPFLPSVTVDDGGRFIVAWDQGPDVVARRFDGAGLRLGTEFVLSAYTTGNQVGAYVRARPDGSFVALWFGDGPGGRGVFGRRFDASGMPQGTDFVVDVATSGGGYPIAGYSSLGFDGAGNFVVAWTRATDGSFTGISAQRFTAAGLRVGDELQVNTYTTGIQRDASIAVDPGGGFVVTWAGPLARRYDANGQPLGDPFPLNATIASTGYDTSAVPDGAGGFVVSWQHDDPPPLPPPFPQTHTDFVYAGHFDAGGARLGAEFRAAPNSALQPDLAASGAGSFLTAWSMVRPVGGIFAQRVEGTGGPAGPRFQINLSHPLYVQDPVLSANAAGDTVVAWQAGMTNGTAILARRFSGAQAAGLAADPAASATSDGNGLFEAGESAMVAPLWRNFSRLARGAFTGTASSFTGPGAPGAYQIVDGAASYAAVAAEATRSCRDGAADCYVLSVARPATRPVLHWDASFVETLTSSTGFVPVKTWALHLGDSFDDVPRASPFYRFVEAMLHRGVTAGCSATGYCPGAAVSREQMAVFLLTAREGTGYQPDGCEPPNLFTDVPETSPYCRWIEELSRRGVTAGCGTARYCPADPVTRQEMAVFVLRTLDPALDPPACTVPVFNDVPATSPFCRWVEELARRGVVGGCGGGAYCGTAPVTREQMSVFLGLSFGLTVYGP